MKLFLGILLVTLGIVLFLLWMSLSFYIWLGDRINQPADRYVFFSPPHSLKTVLLGFALFFSGIILTIVGFEIIT